MGRLRGFREVDARGSRSITSYFTKTEATVSARLVEDDVAGASGGAGETRTGLVPPGGVMADKSSDEVECVGVIAGARGGAGETMTTAGAAVGRGEERKQSPSCALPGRAPQTASPSCALPGRAPQTALPGPDPMRKRKWMPGDGLAANVHKNTQRAKAAPGASVPLQAAQPDMDRTGKPSKKTGSGKRLFGAPRLVQALDDAAAPLDVGKEAVCVTISVKSGTASTPTKFFVTVSNSANSEPTCYTLHGSSRIAPILHDTALNYIGSETTVPKSLYSSRYSLNFSEKTLKKASRTIRWDERVVKIRAETDEQTFETALTREKVIVLANSTGQAEDWLKEYREFVLRKTKSSKRKNLKIRRQVKSGCMRLRCEGQDVGSIPTLTVVYDRLSYVSCDNGLGTPICCSEDEAKTLIKTWKSATPELGECTLHDFWSFVQTRGSGFDQFGEAPIPFGEGGQMTWKAPRSVAPTPIVSRLGEASDSAYGSETRVLRRTTTGAFEVVRISDVREGDRLASTIEPDGKVRKTLTVSRAYSYEAITMSVMAGATIDFGGFRCAVGTKIVNVPPPPVWRENTDGRYEFVVNVDVDGGFIQRRSYYGKPEWDAIEVFPNREAAKNYAAEKNLKLTWTKKSATNGKVTLKWSANANQLSQRLVRINAVDHAKVTADEGAAALRKLSNCAWSSARTSGDASSYEQAMMDDFNHGARLQKDRVAGESLTTRCPKLLNHALSTNGLFGLPTTAAWFVDEKQTCPFRTFLEDHGFGVDRDLDENMGWFLGLWLGDGTHNSPSVAVAFTEENIAVKIRALADTLSMDTSKAEQQGCWCVRLSRRPGKENLITKFLRSLDVYDNNKTIPPQTILALCRSTRSVRCALIAGLVDSDGSATLKADGITIAQAVPCHNDIVTLVCVLSQSLGACVRRSEKLDRVVQFVREQNGSRTLTEAEIKQQGGEPLERRWQEAGCPRSRMAVVHVSGLGVDLQKHVTVEHKKKACSSSGDVHDFTEIPNMSHELVRGASGYFSWKKEKEPQRVVALYAERTKGVRHACVVTPTGYLLPLEWNDRNGEA